MEKEKRTFLALKDPGTLTVIGFSNSSTRVEELKIRPRMKGSVQFYILSLTGALSDEGK